MNEIPFERSFASHEKAIYWSSKNNILPKDIYKSSHNKYIFDCPCEHEFEISLSKILNNQWCPYCANPSKKLCSNEECKQCFEKSFASHEKAKYWSNKNKIKPREVFKGSENKYLFDCKCGHEFQKILYSITGKRNQWCQYCCKSSKILCNNEDCKSCFEKSFASHEKSQYWSKKNELKPRKVFKSSNKKYLFDCKCGHEFKTELHSIVNEKWCAFCVNQKLCNDENCKNCFEKSFASHEKSKYWSDKNKLKPRDVFKSSGKKYFFICNKNHIFDTSLNLISKGRWCSVCKNKTEEKLFGILKIEFPNIKHQFKANWCKNPITNKYLPFDFVLENHKIIIELDGAQHFRQVANWTSPEQQYERDSYKMECANNNDYSMIRIFQEDVYDDTFDWYTSLKESIQSIIESKEIENHFISFNDIYSKFI